MRFSSVPLRPLLSIALPSTSFFVIDCLRFVFSSSLRPFFTFLFVFFVSPFPRFLFTLSQRFFSECLSLKPRVLYLYPTITADFVATSPTAESINRLTDPSSDQSIDQSTVDQSTFFYCCWSVHTTALECAHDSEHTEKALKVPKATSDPIRTPPQRPREQ